MGLGRCGAVAVAAMVMLAQPYAAAAQETAFKGGVTISRLQTDLNYWDDDLVSTTFGGHVRLRLGPIYFQPELLVITKGAQASQPSPAFLEEDQLRIDYIDVPLLLAVPIRIGALEPYIAAGPTIMLESRCRSFVRREGLRTNLPCDPPPAGSNLFERTAFDWGATVSGGLTYPLLGGRVLVEARHTRGLRDIYKGEGAAEVRNRTTAFLLGYSMAMSDRQQ
jgi:hypothetical protein